MRTFNPLSLVVFTILPSCVSSAPHVRSRSPVVNSNSFSMRIVATHNCERISAGVAPLAWDPALEAGAAAYAHSLALTGIFAHSDRRSRGGSGENLWMGTRGAFSLEQMIGSWLAEKRMFVRGIFPRVSRTGNWTNVGHYSQMIWPMTTRVGCAVASNERRIIWFAAISLPAISTGAACLRARASPSFRSSRLTRDACRGAA